MTKKTTTTKSEEEPLSPELESEIEVTLDLLQMHSRGMENITEAYPILGQALMVHRNFRGNAMEYAAYPYMIPLIVGLTTERDTVIMSATQTGKTELMIILALYEAGWIGRIVALMMAQAQVRDRFVQNRIEKVLREIPEYRKRTPSVFAEQLSAAAKKRAKRDPDNLKLKRFGPGTLMFLASGSPNDVVEFSADTMVIDELDLCDIDNVSKAENRLQMSPDARVIKIGNPTVDTAPLAKAFAASTQHRWHFECNHCGTMQALDWFRHVVYEDESGVWKPRDSERAPRVIKKLGKVPGHFDIRPVCEACEEPFERRVRGAAWIAEYPERVKVGRHISRLMILNKTLAEGYQKWVEIQGDPVAVRTFFNDYLGITYEGEGEKFTEDLLESVATAPSNMITVPADWSDGRRVVAGVDVGARFNVTIATVETHEGKDKAEPVVRSFRTAHSWAELDKLIEEFGISVMVVDAEPATMDAKAFRDKHKREKTCLVSLARFSPKEKDTAGNSWGFTYKPKTRAIGAYKHDLLSYVLGQFSIGAIQIPWDFRMVSDLVRQMTGDYRAWDDKRQKYVWVKEPPDDYLLSCCYMFMAKELAKRGGRAARINNNPRRTRE